MFDPRDKKYPSKDFDDEEWELEENDDLYFEDEDDDYDYHDRD